MLKLLQHSICFAHHVGKMSGRSFVQALIDVTFQCLTSDGGDTPPHGTNKKPDIV